MTSFLLFDLFFWTYVALLLAAAAFDVGRFVILNWISVALVALFGLALLAHPVSPDWPSHLGRQSVVVGKSVSVRVDLGSWRIIKKKNLLYSKNDLSFGMSRFKY